MRLVVRPIRRFHKATRPLLRRSLTACAFPLGAPFLCALAGIAVLAAGIGSASALEQARTTILKPERVALLPEMVTAYADTMLTHRSDQMVSAYPNARPLTEPVFKRFRWRAEDGSVVERIGDGQFRVTFGDCVGSMCSNLDCTVTRWPELMCVDGSVRRMSAPDLQTVVMDGRTFKRSLPVPDPELPETGPILPEP